MTHQIDRHTAIKLAEYYFQADFYERYKSYLLIDKRFDTTTGRATLIVQISADRTDDPSDSRFTYIVSSGFEFDDEEEEWAVDEVSIDRRKQPIDKIW
jgi:hypothetical protein